MAETAPLPGGPEPDTSSTAGAALRDILTASHLLSPDGIPQLARRYAPAFGATGALCYLADLQQTVLIPFVAPEGVDTNEQLSLLPIDATIAGRVFQHLEVLTQQRDHGGTTLWLPLLDGSERLGVVAMLYGDAEPPQSDADVQDLRAFASLLAELVMTKTSYGDTIVRLRRRAEMGLAAELQWSMLPPLTFACPAVTVAAALEPAYDVAGDSFDYAVDAGWARVGVFDAMGHGLLSSQVAAMSISTYRHARRRARSLTETYAEIDATILEVFGGATFTTALLVELDTRSGLLQWINAGHPDALLIRHGQMIKTLRAARRPPLGMRLSKKSPVDASSVGVEQLEPGDCVLLYTDGVIEARSPTGEFFGVQRLVDLVVRNLASGLPAPETMRRVVRALLEHQKGQLDDDASMAFVQWHSDTEAFTVTGPTPAT